MKIIYPASPKWPNYPIPASPKWPLLSFWYTWWLSDPLTPFDIKTTKEVTLKKLVYIYISCGTHANGINQGHALVIAPGPWPVPPRHVLTDGGWRLPGSVPPEVLQLPHVTCHGNRYSFTLNSPWKCLVAGWATPLKNMKVNGKDYPIYYGK